MSGHATAFYNQELHRELRKIFLKTLVLRLAAGLLGFLAVAAWVFLIVVIWTSLSGEPAVWQTLAVSRVALLVFAGFFVFLVIVPLVRTPRLDRIAFEIENRRDFKDIVAAGYQFSEEQEVPDGYSIELVREVIHRAVKSIRGLQVRFLFLSRRQLMLAPVAYAALLVLVVSALVSPQSLLEAGNTIVAPRSAAAIEREANLHASPGDVTVLSGTDVEVSAVDLGGADKPVVLAYDLAEGFWKSQPTVAREVFVSDGKPIIEHTFTFEDIRNSLSYYFESEGRRSPEYRITVVHKPVISEFDVVVTPPDYTGESPDTLSDSGGNVQVLEGTRVEVAARANNELRGAWVRFDEKEPEPVEHSGTSLGFDFVALHDGTYSILLEDNLGHKTDDPLVYGVEVYKDNPPVLDVLKPGEDAALPRNMMVEVGFIASDDYGLSRADIFYRKSGEEKFRRSRIPLEADKGKRDIAKSFIWDVSDLTLFPGDYVEYFVQVQDNNIVTGPGVTKSRVFTISVPTMAELYDMVREEDARRSDLLDEAVKEAEDFQKRMETLSREFKKTQELDWSQKKEVDKAIASQQSVQEKLQDIQESLDKTLEELSSNQMTSQEIGEKLEAINELIEELDSEALNQYMEELRKAMEKLDPEQVQKALENMTLSAEQLLQSLERTESLLREIQQEQEMEEIVRKTKELLEEQDDLQNRTAEAEEQESDEMGELSDEQQELSAKADQLQEDMESLSEKLDDPQLSEQMEQTSEEFSESKTSEQMKQASKNLKQGQKQQAMENQQQVMDNLIALFNKMSAMQMSMQAASERRMAASLQRLAKNTLELSFKQEQLTNRLREQLADEDISDVRALAEEQQAYMNAVGQIADGLYELAKRSVEIPQELLQMLGQTIAQMQSVVMFLEQNKGFMSTTSATQSVTGLNEITMDLLSASQNCSSSSCQSCGQGQHASLQQLLSGQRSVIEKTQELLAMKALQEQFRQERQAAIERLLGQQRSLKDLAEEIKEHAGEGERVLGRMDKIVEEMEEVIRDLESGTLDEQTHRNEERILSRLLDAQRSVHSRDYEKKRLSMTARDLYSEALDGKAPDRTSQLLREEIRRAMTLKAPGEFEELIRLYFRALAEEAPPGGVSE